MAETRSLKGDIVLSGAAQWHLGALIGGSKSGRTEPVPCVSS